MLSDFPSGRADRARVLYTQGFGSVLKSGHHREYPNGEEPPAHAPSDFDADAYLRAFPDVAKGIADGLALSPWDHYRKSGYIEGRLSRNSYLLIANGRQPEGYIKSYGHSSVAGGWIFCGWTPEQRGENKFTGIVAHFENGDISGGSDNALYHHCRTEEAKEFVVLFLQGANTSLGELTCIDVRLDRLMLTIPTESSTYLMSDQEILAASRSHLLEDLVTDSSRELFTILSTSGYGRLRRAFNTLSGTVDYYGYHGASGGWFICGWVTRSWDADVTLEKLIGHFADGDLESDETIVGFWSRDDIVDRGIGYVIFMRGPARVLGALISVELRSDGLPSLIRTSKSSQRFRDEELSARLRPIATEVSAPDISSILLTLLSRKTYAGVDTLAALSDPVFLEFDEVIACPPGGLAMMGWFLAKPGVVKSVRLRSETNNKAIEFKNGITIERPDVIAAMGAEHGFEDTRCGFIVYLPASISHRAETYVEVETAQREIGFRKLPAPKLEGISAIKRLLAAVEVRYSAVPHAFDRTLGPVVELLNRRRLATRSGVDAVEFGRICTSPRFSVIIPLYGRLDYVECQLGFMSSHPPAFDYEFIFVLDDPPKRREAERLFGSVYSRFRVPFRVLMMEDNVGYGPANNVGLRVARGNYVCFMNSDVFPGQPDWLESLAQQLEAHPSLGVVGPLLLHGDGSVQHQGMAFEHLPEFGNWLFCVHPGKGKKRTPASGLRRHISITGACMVMRTDLAREMGAFDESYVIGDFEDSDLCLRLHEKGLECAVDLDIQLFHLERRSQASAAQNWRLNLTLYNAWVHQRRWADTIAIHPLRVKPGLYGDSDTKLAGP